MVIINKDDAQLPVKLFDRIELRDPPVDAKIINGGWRNAQLAMEKGPASWLYLPISMVASATETKTYPTTVGEVLEGIRAGKWEKIVKRVRDRHDKAFRDAEEEGKPDPGVAAKKAAHSLKLKMPAVTWSGAFLERVDSAIETHSGFLCIDADNCTEPAGTRAKLAADPYVQAAFISPTGTGCKALVRIPADANSHAKGFAAARKHFSEAHGIAIDEACKNVSRLCYVAYDPEAFIRREDAKLLELLPEEQPAAQQPTEAARGELEGLMFLPRDEFTTYSKSAARIFKRICEHKPPEMFLRSGNIVTIKKTASESGVTQLSIEDTSANDFCSEVEKYGTLYTWGRDQNHKPVVRPDGLMPERIAKIIMATREREELPPLVMIHRCPLLIEREGKPVVLNHGYHPDRGGRYVASNAKVNIMPFKEAAELLLGLIEDFPFASLADKCRAIVAIITPALRFGGLLRCHFPALLVEADRPQAGKGTLVEAIQRSYGELPELASKRKGGVGSFDEEISKQFLRGRPFIQIDNIRDALDSEFLEAAITCPFGGTVSARIPYRPGISIDPNRHIFHLTSNRFESTQDLAARACVIRLLKRDNVPWKKFDDGLELLPHLEANPETSLSIIYSIAAQWVARGKPRNENELRGEGRFREYWQVGDWIVRQIFDLPSPLDGHEKIQRRVANAAQTWARALGNLLKAQKLLGEELSASQLVELVNEADESDGVAIAGVAPDAEDIAKARRVGSIMGQLFTGTTEIEVDVYRIKRVEHEEYRPERRDTYMRKSYVFQLIGGQE
jgi:hypothetical protein